MTERFSFEDYEGSLYMPPHGTGIKVTKKTTIKCPSCHEYFPFLDFLDKKGTMKQPWVCPKCGRETTHINLWEETSSWDEQLPDWLKTKPPKEKRRRKYGKIPRGLLKVRKKERLVI